MIVVIGSPVADLEAGAAAAVPAGLAAAIAMAAAAAGSAVQLVGKAGEDPYGDEVVLGLAAASVGHVAVLRDAANPTPARALAAPRAESPAVEGAPGTQPGPVVGLPVDAADIDLALRYLPDYGVVVVADDLEADALRVVADAASWAGASLVVTVPAGATPTADASGSTVVFERPDGGDADGTFARFVGAFAAAIDRGASTEAAIREITGRFGAT